MGEQNLVEERPAGSVAFVQQQAFDAMFADLSGQLTRKASMLCRNEYSPSFATGDLLNDLYLRLRKNPAYALAIAARGRLDFMHAASGIMRNILTDAARRRSAGKRGGHFLFVTLNQADEQSRTTLSPEMLLDIDDALRALEQSQPRRASILKMRFYGGLSIRELQEYWGLADATVERDIRLALKLLYTLLKSDSDIEKRS